MFATDQCHQYLYVLGSPTMEVFAFVVTCAESCCESAHAEAGTTRVQRDGELIECGVMVESRDSAVEL